MKKRSTVRSIERVTVRAVVAGFLLLSISAQLSCYAQESPVEPATTSASQPVAEKPSFKRSESLLELDQKIMLRCIDLARFNIQFHEVANKRWYWRNYLYPAAQEGGTAANLSNGITDLSQRARGLDDPDLISDSARKSGLAAAITGSSISGGSSALELAQNTMVILLARRKGYSPSDSLAYVKRAAAETEEWLDERDRCIEKGAVPEAELGVRKAESRLLRHVRNQLVREFIKWSTYSRESMWRENTFYTLDTGQNFTQMASSILSLQSFTRPNRAGSSAIVAIAGYAVASVNPAISACVARVVRSRQRKRLLASFGELEITPEAKDMAEWQDNIKQLKTDFGDEKSIRELSFLSENAEKFNDRLQSEISTIAKLRAVADQKITTAPIIGAGNLGRAICSAVSFYGVKDNPVLRNRIAFAGRIGSVAAQSYSLLVTGRTLVRTAVFDRRRAKSGELPSQLLAARMKHLDELEAVVKKAEF